MKKIGLGEKIAYGFGDVASCLLYHLQAYYLMYFYTNVAGFSLIAAGNILLVARIISACDPIVGILVDKTESKHGKARPYLLWFSIPLCAMAAMMYFIPEIGAGGKMAYACVTYALFMALYAFVNLPYGVMMQHMTQDQGERTILTTFRMLGANGGGLLVSAVTLPLVFAVGSGDEKRGFAIVACTYAAVALALFYAVFKICREHLIAENRSAPDISSWRRGGGGGTSAREGLRALMKNRPWLVLIAYTSVNTLRTSIQISVLIYYVMYTLKRNQDGVALFLALGTVTNAIAVAVVPLLLRKFSKKTTLMLGIGLACLAYAGGYFSGAHYAPALLFYVISRFFFGFTMALDFSMLADAIDYGHASTGVRVSGLGYSIFSFLIKVSSGAAGALAGLGLSLFGFDPASIDSGAGSGASAAGAAGATEAAGAASASGAAIVSDSASMGIMVMMFVVPAALSLLMLWIVSQYKYDERRAAGGMEARA